MTTYTIKPLLWEEWEEPAWSVVRGHYKVRYARGRGEPGYHSHISQMDGEEAVLIRNDFEAQSCTSIDEAKIAAESGWIEYMRQGLEAANT